MTTILVALIGFVAGLLVSDKTERKILDWINGLFTKKIDLDFRQPMRFKAEESRDAWREIERHYSFDSREPFIWNPEGSCGYEIAKFLNDELKDHNAGTIADFECRAVFKTEVIDGSVMPTPIKPTRFAKGSDYQPLDLSILWLHVFMGKNPYTGICEAHSFFKTGSDYEYCEFKPRTKNAFYVMAYRPEVDENNYSIFLYRRK